MGKPEGASKSNGGGYVPGLRPPPLGMLCAPIGRGTVGPNCGLGEPPTGSASATGFIGASKWCRRCVPTLSSRAPVWLCLLMVASGMAVRSTAFSRQNAEYWSAKIERKRVRYSKSRRATCRSRMGFDPHLGA